RSNRSSPGCTPGKAEERAGAGGCQERAQRSPWSQVEQARGPVSDTGPVANRDGHAGKTWNQSGLSGLADTGSNRVRAKVEEPAEEFPFARDESRGADRGGGGSIPPPPIAGSITTGFPSIGIA